MLRRLLLLLLLIWILGFAWFALSLPGRLEGGKTDGVIVLTGGEGRIERALEVLRGGSARRMLVSGVDRKVRPQEFEVQYKVPHGLMQCCVTLGYASIDTRSNAREAARWIAQYKLRSVRLVTTDWHMRRAAYEISQMKPQGTRVTLDAVPSDPGLKTLIIEYHKLLARRLAQFWGS